MFTDRTSALAVCTLLLTSACGGASSEQLNVLLVTLDTTRADHLGVYGREDDLTPNFDSVAEAGTCFELAIATASVTPVSHASILTGRGNKHHGVRVLTAQGGYRLPDDVPTLSTILKEHGYHTAAIHSAFPVSSYFGFERGHDSFDDIDATFQRADDSEHSSWDVATFQRRSDETTDRVLAFLESTREPFGLWVHYWDPHDKMRTPPEFEDGARGTPYSAEVRYMDEQFGRVLEELRTSGRMDNTVVVIVSDHGQGLSDHDWRGHRILYQEQIHVPLLISVPGMEQVARVSDLVGTPDILPTLLEILELPAPAGMTGVSFVGLMQGRAEPVGRVAFADQINLFDENATMVAERPKDDFLYCAMDRRWKLIYRPRHYDQSELYDLETDPAESINLFAERPDEAVRLLKELAREAPWVTEPFAPLEGGDEGARADALDALEALGYVGDGGTVQTNIDWRWVCPDGGHASAFPAPGTCATCGTPLVPRAD